nr:hypothetical protein KPHV_29600 [Kitasatospora purpeofusca]
MTYHSNASALPTHWKKASASNPNDNCVECGSLTGTVVVRDSKDPHGPAHSHTPAAFGAFAAAVATNTLTPVV